MCISESKRRVPVASDAGLRLVTDEVAPAPEVMRPTKLEELHRSGLIAVCWDLPRAMATKGITQPLGRGSSGGTADVILLSHAHSHAPSTRPLACVLPLAGSEAVRSA